MLAPFTVEQARLVPGMEDDVEVWTVIATFLLYDDARRFQKGASGRGRKLRVGTVQVAVDESRGTVSP